MTNSWWDCKVWDRIKIFSSFIVYSLHICHTGHASFYKRIFKSIPLFFSPWIYGKCYLSGIAEFQDGIKTCTFNQSLTSVDYGCSLFNIQRNFSHTKARTVHLPLLNSNICYGCCLHAPSQIQLFIYFILSIGMLIVSDQTNYVWAKQHFRRYLLFHVKSKLEVLFVISNPWLKTKISQIFGMICFGPLPTLFNEMN